MSDAEFERWDLKLSLLAWPMYEGMQKLKLCDNKLCMRLTTCMYCCGQCDYADQQKFEIHEDGPLGHSISCNERHERRTSDRSSHYHG